MAFYVAKKVLITALVAILGAALAIAGGDVRSIETIVGLTLVTLSPIISYIVVYYDIKRSSAKNPEAR